MKKKLPATTLSLSLIIGMVYSQATPEQNWVKEMQNPNANFYDIQRDFNAYWQGKMIEKGKGWTVFKRWENFMEPRSYPNGTLPNPAILVEEYNKYKQNFSSIVSANWTSLGPSTVPSNGGGA